MRNIFGRLVSVTESVTDLGRMDLEKALTAFEQFPWAKQVARVEETGVYPTLSFFAPDSNGSYISIVPNEDGSFMTMIEIVKRKGLLGMLFRKEAFLITDADTAENVHEWTREFFQLERDELFDRVKKKAARSV